MVVAANGELLEPPGRRPPAAGSGSSLSGHYGVVVNLVLMAKCMWRRSSVHAPRPGAIDVHCPVDVALFV